MESAGQCGGDAAVAAVRQREGPGFRTGLDEAFPNWSATSAAVRLPLNLSGAMRTLMDVPFLWSGERVVEPRYR